MVPSRGGVAISGSRWRWNWTSLINSNPYSNPTASLTDVQWMWQTTATIQDRPCMFTCTCTCWASHTCTAHTLQTVLFHTPIHASTCRHIHASTGRHIHASTRTHIHASTCTHIRALINTHIQLYVHSHMNEIGSYFIHIIIQYWSVNAYTHTPMHTLTLTQTHTSMFIDPVDKTVHCSSFSDLEL